MRCQVPPLACPQRLIRQRGVGFRFRARECLPVGVSRDVMLSAVGRGDAVIGASDGDGDAVTLPVRARKAAEAAGFSRAVMPRLSAP